MRNFLFGLGLLCVAVAGCSEDDPGRVPEQYVSDVGSLVQVHEYVDGSVDEFEYEGILFLGDILLSDYEYALEVIVPRFSENEVLLKVSNSRVFPPSQINVNTVPEDGFSLKTCTADSTTYCDRGKIYVFRKTADGFGLAPILSWLIISD